MFLSVSALFDNRQIRIVLRCVKTHVAPQQRIPGGFRPPARGPRKVFSGAGRRASFTQN
jgi:hypothetical protein